MMKRRRVPAEPPDSVDLAATLELLASLTQYAEAGAVQPHTLAQAAEHALESHGDHIEVLLAVAKLHLATNDRLEGNRVLGRAAQVAPGDARVAQLMAESSDEPARNGPPSIRPHSTIQPSALGSYAGDIDTRVRRRKAQADAPPPSSHTPVSRRAPGSSMPPRTTLAAPQCDARAITAAPVSPSRGGNGAASPPQERGREPLDTAPPTTPRSAESPAGPLLRPTVRMARVNATPDRQRNVGQAGGGRWGKGDGREPFDSRPDRDPPSESPRSRPTKPVPGSPNPMASKDASSSNPYMGKGVQSSNPYLAQMAREAFGSVKSARAAAGNLKLLDPHDERRHLDRYELIGEIASGGMATVYLARLAGVAGFQRFFAIKRLHPHLANEQEFIDMFLDEARLAAGIHHPNVVPILEIGTSDSGYYLVMEYVEGDTLSGVISRATAVGGLPRGIALRVMIDSLHGLNAAHDLTDPNGDPVDLVHRDCSPQNILVGVDGASRITDFGVARATSRLSTTRSATVKGKLAYLSPEQATGRSLDRRSDLFGMGAILWEALAGKRLFRADTDGATLTRILVEPVPLLSAHAEDIPEPLSAVVMQALARDPAERFFTGAEMADAIEQAVKQANLESLQIASPREVAGYMRELFGVDIAARRDAVRTWSAQCADPGAASGPRSQGARRPFDSNAAAGAAHDQSPRLRSDVRQILDRGERESPTPDDEPAPQASRHGSRGFASDDSRSTPTSAAAQTPNAPVDQSRDEDDDDSDDATDQPPSSKTERSVVHAAESVTSPLPSVSVEAEKTDAASRSLSGAEGAADAKNLARDPAVISTKPETPSPLRVAVRADERDETLTGGKNASANRARGLTKPSRGPPLLVIIIAVALIAAALTAYLIRP